MLVQFKYSSEEDSKQVKESSRRLSTFKFYLSLLVLCILFSFLLLFNCVYHVFWLSHCLLELQKRMNQWITSFILCYVNGLSSIVSLNVSCMLGHHIWYFNQICTQWELVHFSGYKIEFSKRNEITWRQGFLLKIKIINLAW